METIHLLLQQSVLIMFPQFTFFLGMLRRAIRSKRSFSVCENMRQMRQGENIHIINVLDMPKCVKTDYFYKFNPYFGACEDAFPNDFKLSVICVKNIVTGHIGFVLPSEMINKRHVEEESRTLSLGVCFFPTVGNQLALTIYRSQGMYLSYYC